MHYWIICDLIYTIKAYVNVNDVKIQKFSALKEKQKENIFQIDGHPCG